MDGWMDVWWCSEREAVKPGGDSLYHVSVSRCLLMLVRACLWKYQIDSNLFDFLVLIYIDNYPGILVCLLFFWKNK